MDVMNMGMFDTIEYKCPNCGKETNSQTKLMERTARYHKLGSKVPIPNALIVLKSPCDCGEYAAMLIENGEITKFIQTSTMIVEECGGYSQPLYDPGRYAHAYDMSFLNAEIEVLTPEEACKKL
jgi:phage FluMu protein Com